MRRDYRIYSGDTVSIAAVARKDDGTLINLTGASITWRLARVGSTGAAIEKSTSSGISVTDATAGEYTITVSPSDTADLSGEFVHQARVTESGGAVSTVLNGHITIRGDIE